MPVIRSEAFQTFFWSVVRHCISVEKESLKQKPISSKGHERSDSPASSSPVQQVRHLCPWVWQWSRLWRGWPLSRRYQRRITVPRAAYFPATGIWILPSLLWIVGKVFMFRLSDQACFEIAWNDCSKFKTNMLSRLFSICKRLQQKHKAHVTPLGRFDIEAK